MKLLHSLKNKYKFKIKKIVSPLKNKYCQGTERASSIYLTTKAPKDQIIPANKTIKIAKLVLFFVI